MSLWFAAEAAARHVPLKRQGVRQFTDTCRVAGFAAEAAARPRTAEAAGHWDGEVRALGVACAVWVGDARLAPS